MRTAVITVAHEADSLSDDDFSAHTWVETYRENNGTRNGLKSTTTDVEAWARGLIQYYNNTITNKRDKRRVFVSVAVTDNGVHAVAHLEHDWHKTNLITISDRHGVYDAMKCERCGVTGKRFGLTHIKRDAKFRAKKFRQMQPAVN